MAKVEVNYEKGERLEQPKVYEGTFKQYGKIPPNGGMRRDYFLLRNENGESLIPPLWDFSKPSYTKENETGIIQVYKGYEYVDDGYGNKTKYYQEWCIDFCGNYTEIMKDIQLAENTSASRNR